MLRGLVIAAALASAAHPAVARAAKPDVCSALRTLAATVGKGEPPLVVNFSNSQDPGDPLTFSRCWPVDGARAAAICHQLSKAAGLEHAFLLSEWVADCVKAQGGTPHVHRLPSQDWVPAFDRVDADLPRSLHLALSYTPDSDEAPFFGTYRLEMRRRGAR